MYADQVTDSMRRAVDETNRRRAKQKSFNDAHGIEPMTIVKSIRDITSRLQSSHSAAEARGEYSAGGPGKAGGVVKIPKTELQRVLADLEKQMKEAAKNLEFEKAAMVRDQIYELRAILAEQEDLPPWQKARLLAGEVE